MSDLIYFEDVKVGDTQRFGGYEVTREEIVAYAREFDPQPFHLDEEAARGSLFGRLVASGWHTAAITMRLLTQSVPIANGVIGSGGESSWPRPTLPGDILTVTSVIEEITPSRSRPDRGRVLMRSETRNQRDEIVQVLTSRLVVLRRAGAS